MLPVSPEIVLGLVGIIITLAVWIYIEDRQGNKKKFDDHNLRIQSLESERTDIAVMRTDIKYIRQALDDLRGRK